MSPHHQTVSTDPGTSKKLPIWDGQITWVSRPPPCQATDSLDIYTNLGYEYCKIGCIVKYIGTAQMIRFQSFILQQLNITFNINNN